MNEWLNEKSQDLAKPLSIKTEPLEVNTIIAEENAEFVRCMPSPHANSLSHLRRHSMSGCNQTKTAATTAVTNVAEVSLGSAKKVSVLFLLLCFITCIVEFKPNEGPVFPC